MANSASNNPKKKRGRPATGGAPMVGIRMHESFQDQIRAWAVKQSDKPPFAIAIRRLVEFGLKAQEADRTDRRQAEAEKAMAEQAAIEEEIRNSHEQLKAARLARIAADQGPNATPTKRPG
jgi:hypothetical protein